MAKNNGMSANHARIENSKSGNARISKTAETNAKPAFEIDGKIFFNEASFIIFNLSKRLERKHPCLLARSRLCEKQVRNAEH